MESVNYLEPETSSALPEMARTFTFRGTTLAKYSWKARAALFRICRGRTVAFEEYAYLVFLLMKDPAQWDAIRDEKETAIFREAAGEWAESEQLADGDGWEELKMTAEEILGAVNRARAIEPAGKGSKKE